MYISNVSKTLYNSETLGGRTSLWSLMPCIYSRVFSLFYDLLFPFMTKTGSIKKINAVVLSINSA